MTRRGRRRLARSAVLAGLVLVLAVALSPGRDQRAEKAERSPTVLPGPRAATRLRLDLVSPRRRATAPPPGWLAYDGAPYSPDQGFGWIQPLPPYSEADRGEDATILLADGTATSPRRLGRPELAHWQGTHRENRPLVFRIDLANGWYRVACSSVDPGTPLPLVDQRSFKCRAHDVVFAGPRHGPPLAVPGMTLVEGADVVEVTDGHLRVVVGDPAYAGWTWRPPGAWYEGWPDWVGRWGGQRYAEHWYQKITRRVDPGFHSLRLNALEIEPVSAPARRGPIVFRDVFNRDDGPDLNRGVPADARWARVDLDAGGSGVRAALEGTALALTGARSRATVAFVQPRPSPARGLVRYSTRLTVATGEGSRSGSGVQEAGLLLLDPAEAPPRARSAFVGVTVGGPSGGGLTVRAAADSLTDRAEVTVRPPRLPLAIGAGEYELVVDHDVDGGALSRIALNGIDVTGLVPADLRRRPVTRGRFGLRSAMDPGRSGAILRQFYWALTVECLDQPGRERSCR